MAGFLTYWHTLRHLKPVQFYGRAWFRLNRPHPDFAEAPGVRQPDGIWVSPARRRQSLLASDSFFFLNEEHRLAEIGWDSSHIEKLWRYNLHYFDDLNAEGSEGRTSWHRELLERWVLENPPADGTAWEPYPTSLRIINWIKWTLSGNFLSHDCHHSLAVQVRWLSQRMEMHLLGNHLFANSKALIFAGLFFRGAEADRWFEKGSKLLAREIPEQILADGGQFERSTMYHALALEDMLDLFNLTRNFRTAVPASWVALLESWPRIIGRMRQWLAVTCHPDGNISFFNDSAIGVSPSPAELEGYAQRLGFPSHLKMPDGITQLPESGYIRVQLGQMVALLDVAPIGPDYLPGHAHADTLSFELSLFGQRVFVNSGTSCYGSSAERLRQRGTAAHNTVEIDGQNSSEVWDSFRVARRARPRGGCIEQNRGFTTITFSHDGYRWLGGKPQHTRTWQFTGQELTIEDCIKGDFSQAKARFHLHPSVVIKDICSSDVVLELPNGEIIKISTDCEKFILESGSWHPEFGCSEPNFCLSVVGQRPKICVSMRWGKNI